jgi:DNA-binding GntR family transcriptional regulator
MAGYSSLIRESKPRVRETSAPKRTGLTVNDLYEQLKEMAVLYTIRPGERVNELELAEKFDVSRTPLREALNRLVAESLLNFVPNRGFFVRELHRQDIFDLFELRRSIEASAVQLAVERADIKDVRALRKFWKDVMKNKAEQAPATQLVAITKWSARCTPSTRASISYAGSTLSSAAMTHSQNTSIFWMPLRPAMQSAVAN